MIEVWLDNLNEIARVAMKGLGAALGVQIDSALRAAIAWRIERHVATQGYFESAERLVSVILECAEASKAPFEERRRLDLANAALLALEGGGGRDTATRGLRQELTKAKEGGSGATRHGQEARIRVAKVAL